MSRSPSWSLRALLAAVVLASLPLAAATYTVTNTNDSGPGSLRDAMSKAGADGGGTIHFSIGSGHQVINLLTKLPEISATVIDGRTQPGYAGTPLIELDGSLISGADFHIGGITFSSSSIYALAMNNFPSAALRAIGSGTVRGCYLGIDVTGTEARGNMMGIRVDPAFMSNDTTPLRIGGANDEDRNIIISDAINGIQTWGALSNPVHIDGNIFGGNAAMSEVLMDGGTHISAQYNNGNTPVPVEIGVRAPNVFMGGFTAVESFYTNHMLVANNYIGTTPAGLSRPPSWGVYIHQSNDTRVVANTIHAFRAGTYVSGTSLRNQISINRMFHSELGIDLDACCVLGPFNANDSLDGDTGPNNVMNHPVITSAATITSTTSIAGTLHSVPNRTYTIELFASEECGYTGSGPGEKFLTYIDVTTDGSGNAPFSTSVPRIEPGMRITATATSELEGTSEFSKCVEVQGPGVIQFSGSLTHIDEFQSAATIAVARTQGSVGPASVNWSVTGGTATPSTDFSPAAGIVQFAEGQTSATIAIAITNDTIYETQETIFLALSNPTGATLGAATKHTVQIINDDAGPNVSMTPATLTYDEGDSGHTDVTVTFHLDRAVEAPYSITYSTVANSAQAGADFIHVPSTKLTIPAGQTEGSITLKIVGDAVPEDHEFFALTWSHGLFFNSQRPVTILNDDAPAEIRIHSMSTPEGNDGLHLVPVSITADKPMHGVIHVSTQPVTASAGSDFEETHTSVNLNGQTSLTFHVGVRGDLDPEAQEYFLVKLGPMFGMYTIVDDTAVVTIVNDDAGVGPARQWIAAGSSGTYAIQLAAPAPSDATIALTSSAPEVVSVPPSIVVPTGATDATFDAKALLPDGSSVISVTLPPSLGGTTKNVEALTYLDRTVIFQPAELRLFIGQTAQVRVSLQPASPAPIEAFVSFDSSVISAPTRVTIPAGGEGTFDVRAIGAGPMFLRVTLPPSQGDKQAALRGIVIAAPTGPAIDRITPATGPAAGGTIVEIGGVNFTSNCVASFGDALATSNQFVSSSLLKATTPAHAAGIVALTLRCGSETATLVNAFQYIGAGPTIQSVQPQSGAVTGGTLTRITGTNFDSSCWPKFGGVPATDVDVLSANELIAATPAHAAGNVDIVMQCTAGTSAPSSLFTYVSAAEPGATLSSVTPSAASAGESITINGLRFRGDDRIEIGGVEAEILDTLPDAHVVRVPELPLGKTSIDLIDANGRRVTLGPVFTVTEAAPPRVTSVAPASVPAGGEVLLTGNGFRPGYSFRTGGKIGTVLSRTYTRVHLRVAHDTPSGAHAVEVLTPAGQLSSIGPSLNVTETGLLLRGVTPNCATTDGLVEVTIHGNGFTNATQLRFGENAATNITFLNAMTLRARVPAGTAGLTTVTAVDNNTTATLTNAFEYHSPFDPDGGCSGRRSRGARH